ncbi:hypothetical protein FE257_011823 [Aspergillus nanangensis]|uniref:Nuclear speckle splicing regulatory protein 1 N-terminal domain-containing protein n=1 Tax=Aspergillus nanangensis TaxID=2582783 RepID=A0AAD4CVN9_ASPNN|nr:hypothetical protein FE257_011823 [Aspergillus nanangensis]
MPPKISLGLNLSNNKNPHNASASAGQKRKKAIFDADSDSDTNSPNKAEEITTLGGLKASQPTQKRQQDPPPKRKIPFGGPQSNKPTIKPLSKASIFADDDDDDQDAPHNTPSTQYGLNPPSTKPKPNPGSSGNTNDGYTDLSALHSSRKHAQEAQDLDPSIYSYDAVYESLHSKPEKSKETATDEGPRYMGSLLRSAEVRKRDQLRARDRMLTKEREAEGDEFADKEKFVTAAYKAQQEEMRRVEAEEAEREKQEEERRRANGGSGMVGFYRDMLSRGEQQHEAVVKATEEAARRVQAGEVEEDKEKDKKEEQEEGSKGKTEAQKAAELNSKGAHIAINEEGQVVDKRQLLSAGLNVAPKPKPQGGVSAASRAAAATSRFEGGQQRGARAGQRSRQTEMIASQLEERAKQEEEAEKAQQKEVAERSRSQKTQSDVSSAKERYLARKREREAAQAKGA